MKKSWVWIAAGIAVIAGMLWVSNQKQQTAQTPSGSFEQAAKQLERSAEQAASSAQQAAEDLSQTAAKEAESIQQELSQVSGPQEPQ
jgi:hypothetical protein